MWRILKISALVLAAIILLAVAFLGIPRIYFGPTLPPTNFKQAFQVHTLSVVGTEAEGHNAWDRWSKAMELHHELYVRRAPDRPKAPWKSPDYERVVNIAKALDNDQESLTQARGLLAVAKSAGIFDQLATLRTSQGYLRPPGPDIMMLEAPQDAAGVRPLARLLRLRMREALQQGNQQEVLASVEDMLTLARLVGSEPLLLRRLVAQAITSLVYEELNTAMDRGQITPTISAELLARMEPWQIPPFEYSLAGEQIACKEAIAAKFGDTRIKVANRSYQSKVLDESFELIRSYVNTPISTRGSLPDLPGESSNPLLRFDKSPATFLVPAFGMTISSYESMVCCYRGTLIRLAIVQWQATHGNPPATLSELVPSVIRAIPADPMSDQGYLYKPVPTSNDYTLYSVGLDGVDNGARPNLESPHVALTQRAGRGYDFVFHAPPQAAPPK
jgi:hypothetical protein